jgi:hypothetical protein
VNAVELEQARASSRNRRRLCVCADPKTSRFLLDLTYEFMQIICKAITADKNPGQSTNHLIARLFLLTFWKNSGLGEDI